MRVISIHEYSLRSDIQRADFEQAVERARARGLPHLEGLLEHYLLKGIKGARQDRYASMWIYADRAAWEALWGSPDHPLPPSQYPQSWLAWEETLRPYLDRPPDEVTFTAYEALSRSRV